MRYGNRRIVDFDDSVFTGRYVTGDIDRAYLDGLAERRSDQAKRPLDDTGDDDGESSGLGDIGLHNAV